LRTPTADELGQFFMYDEWTEVRSTNHTHFEKTLPSGEILESHRSFSDDKELSPGRFKAVLSTQLKVGQAEFWEVLRLRRPAPRPSPALEPMPASLPLWLALALEREMRLNRHEIAELDEGDARRRLDEFRSRPRA
jgi:hypothetical protein